MAEEDGRNEAKSEAREDEENLLRRFPKVPAAPDVPDVPKLKPTLPPHPDRSTRPGKVEPGSYNGLVVAATAASSFIMPIMVLTVVGWFLDSRLHHATYWFA